MLQPTVFALSRVDCTRLDESKGEEKREEEIKQDRGGRERKSLLYLTGSLCTLHSTVASCLILQVTALNRRETKQIGCLPVSPTLLDKSVQKNVGSLLYIHTVPIHELGSLHFCFSTVIEIVALCPKFSDQYFN